MAMMGGEPRKLADDVVSGGDWSLTVARSFFCGKEPQIEPSHWWAQMGPESVKLLRLD